MLQIMPVIHLHDEEIEPHILWSPSALVIKFHPGGDLDRFHEFLANALNEAQHKRFLDLWSNDLGQREFDTESGFVVIS